MSVVKLSSDGRRKPGASHRFNPLSAYPSTFAVFEEQGDAHADAAARSKTADEKSFGFDVFLDEDSGDWISAPAKTSRGIRRELGEARYRAGSIVGFGYKEKVCRDFAPKISFSNAGVGADGNASVTINIASQDFSYRDLTEFAQYLTGLAETLGRLDRRQYKADLKAAPTDSKN